MEKKSVILLNRVCNVPDYLPPSNELRFGEIGINIADGSVFFKKADESVVTLESCFLDPDLYALKTDFNDYVTIDALESMEFVNQTLLTTVINRTVAGLELPQLKDRVSTLELSDFATVTYVNNKFMEIKQFSSNVVTANMSNYSLKTHTHDMSAYATKADLANVAFSGTGDSNVDWSAFATTSYVDTELEKKAQSNHTHNYVPTNVVAGGITSNIFDSTSINDMNIGINSLAGETVLPHAYISTGTSNGFGTITSLRKSSEGWSHGIWTWRESINDEHHGSGIVGHSQHPHDGGIMGAYMTRGGDNTLFYPQENPRLGALPHGPYGRIGTRDWSGFFDGKPFWAYKYMPFTGAHNVISLSNSYDNGDIMVTTGCIPISVDDSLSIVESSTHSNQKTVYGVVGGSYKKVEESLKQYAKFYINKISDFDDREEGFTTEGNEVLEKYKDYHAFEVNSVGEGGINVCSLGGNIENGDYITTSSLHGKGMRQSDDLLHNYTVAKSLEDVNWDEEVDGVNGCNVTGGIKWKMVGCTYHCG